MSQAKEAAQNTVRESQMGRTVNVAGTSGAAPLVEEATKNAVEASQLLGAAPVMKTLEAAKVTTEIAV